MPAGTNPIYVSKPAAYWSNNIIIANTTKDLSSGTINNPVFRANSTNGSFLDHIRARASGTNVATVARFFLNNGGATTGAANNAMFTEITLSPTTVSERSSQPDVIVPVKMALQAGYNVHVTLGTAVAAGWQFSAFGGDY
jgi:hypothetical protein